MSFLSEARIISILNEEGVTYNVEKGGEVPSDVEPGDTVNVSEDGVDEGKLKNALTGIALFTALIAGNNAITNSNPQMKSLKAAYEQAKDSGDKVKMKELKDKITKQTIFLDTGKGEPQSIKEIVKKCLNRGMIKENISKVVKKYLAEVKLLNESWMSSSDGSKYKLATEKKALGNLFHPNSDNTAYVYNREHLSNLIKAIGYPDYEEVTSEFINIFAPADEDELRILRNQEGNPELQPNDLTIGMYIRHIKNEFSNKNYPSTIGKQSI